MIPLGADAWRHSSCVHELFRGHWLIHLLPNPITWESATSDIVTTQSNTTLQQASSILPENQSSKENYVSASRQRLNSEHEHLMHIDW